MLCGQDELGTGEARRVSVHLPVTMGPAQDRLKSSAIRSMLSVLALGRVHEAG